jgi:hypothetical protein
VEDKKIVASGSWLYADSVPMPVFVVRLTYDYWYEIAAVDGQLEEGEKPHLDEQGFGYYVSFHGVRPDGGFWPDSRAHRSIDGAKAEAESRIISAITWD